MSSFEPAQDHSYALVWSLVMTVFGVVADLPELGGHELFGSRKEPTRVGFQSMLRLLDCTGFEGFSVKPCVYGAFAPIITTKLNNELHIILFKNFNYKSIIV